MKKTLSRLTFDSDVYYSAVMSLQHVLWDHLEDSLLNLSESYRVM